MIVGSTQFTLRTGVSVADWKEAVEAQVAEAVHAGAEALLFPEYFTIGLVHEHVRGEGLAQKLRDVNHLNQELLPFLAKLTAQNRLTLIAGTIPVFEEEQVHNRAHVFKDGALLTQQDKLAMTRFEREDWNVSGARLPELATFDLAGARCAVLTCYDIEFPQYSVLLNREGVEIVFVPSCTDGEQGYWRVRHCAQARAVENQCFSVMASLVGGVASCEDISAHFGRAGVFTPCDASFPTGGTLGLGRENQHGLLFTKLDLEALRRTRENGTTLNYLDVKALADPS
jgi:predicted amidohydrolase